MVVVVNDGIVGQQHHSKLFALLPGPAVAMLLIMTRSRPQTHARTHPHTHFDRLELVRAGQANRVQEVDVGTEAVLVGLHCSVVVVGGVCGWEWWRWAFRRHRAHGLTEYASGHHRATTPSSCAVFGGNAARCCAVDERVRVRRLSRRTHHGTRIPWGISPWCCATRSRRRRCS